MNPKATKVYKFILKEMNGWSDSCLKDLKYYEYCDDPIYLRVCKILEVKK